MKAKEAIERVRSRFDKRALEEEDLEALRALGLVTIESEDERIRKALVKVFTDKYKKGYEWKEFGIPNRSVLDWLKRQKLILDSLKAAGIDVHQDGSIERHTMPYLEKQKEQKPEEWKEDTQLLAGDYAISHYEQGKTYTSMEVHKMLADAFIAGKSYQKPAEWSEQDEKMMRYVIHSLDTNISDSNFKNIRIWFEYIKDRVQPQPKQEWGEEDEKQYNVLIHDLGAIIERDYPYSENLKKGLYWLKSLPERFNLQPVEWSDEDENYMEEIISNLKYAAKNRKTCSNSLADECIHWLEIRVKSLRPQPKQEWSEEDEKIRQSIIKDIEWEKNYTFATIGEAEVIGKYNEQSNWLKALPERFNLSPKQEWNEEDEKIMEDIILAIREVWQEKDANRMIAKLKSLRPKPHWKPSEEQKPAEYCDDVVEEAEEYTSKVDCGEYGVTVTEAYIAGVLSERNRKPAEWREEDEKFFKVALWHMGYSASNGKTTDCHCETMDWLKGVKERLKSLRPQPHWKPSEEQMNALWCATEHYLESDNEKTREILGKVLESFYHDLKKL